MSAENHEFSLIEWIRARAADHHRLAIGIGDDTAAITFPEASQCLITTDLLLEGVHFTSPPLEPRQIGRKALAVNLSDIAAMAGKPLAAVISIALPRNRGLNFAQQLHEGILELAAEFNTAVAGGDTNIWDGPLAVSVTLLGEATGTGPVGRNGATPDDWIMTTGSFGGSLSGKHADFQPRIAEALRLHETVTLHALIDVSDGLSADLNHILDESRVGAVVYADKIPISDAARQLNDGRSPLEHALGDGEDFELLFTLPPTEGRKLLENPPVEIQLSHVGEIVEAGRRELIDPAGNRTLLPRTGWEHRF